MPDLTQRGGYATTTGDMEWLLRLGLPPGLVAQRMGRSVEAVARMIERNHDD